MIFRNSIFVFSLAVALAILALPGCQPRDSATPRSNGTGRPIRIVTTVAMVTDIVQQVVGDRAEVVGLLNAGVDPHLYHPTREDVQKMHNADVIFHGGLLLEGRMEDAFRSLRKSGKRVVAVAEVLDQAGLRKPEEFEGHFDPHVWMDVSLWSQCVEAVAKAMSEHDAAHASEYAERAAAYRQELTALDEYVRKVIASIPEPQRVLVTAHDAFGYFARAYGMQVKSVQGISTESEAGVADINSLVDFLVERKIGAIFVESSVSDKSLRAVIEGAKQRGWEIRVGGELFSDAMGSADTYEGTYIGMLDHNATTIARELGGDAAERGMNGKLAEPRKPQ